MIKVVATKEILESWKSLKEIRYFSFKSPLYWCYVLFRKIQGFEIGELKENDV